MSGVSIEGNMLICECNKIVEKTFTDYIPTSVSPCTSTIGHESCGFLFNFIDFGKPKHCSTLEELKTMVVEHVKKNNLIFRADKKIFSVSADGEILQKLLLEIHRVKMQDSLDDYSVLKQALKVTKRWLWNKQQSQRSSSR